MASPFSARTLDMAIFRMITLDILLTKLPQIRSQAVNVEDLTYSPKPVKLAPESFPIMLVLLPTLT
jgi:hypothetical protein